MEDHPVKVPDEIAEELKSLNMTLKDFGINTYLECSTTNIIAVDFIAEMQELVSTLDVASRAG